MPRSSSLLKKIRGPQDLKKLSRKQLPQLAEEMRQLIIQVVSQNGGHLASNLGAVELTIALHYVFDSPQDKLVWDVGHQCYPHKLLTGRIEEFKTLRQYKGMAGFPKREESPHDMFNTGHASTSISAALGMTEALDLQGIKGKVLAIIGDGSMTGGIAYEAMNQAGHRKKDLVVVLNDNEMSISPNVGAVGRFISRKMTGEMALKVKKEIKQSMKSIPRVGENLYQMARRMDSLMRRFLSPGLLFEAFGFSYIGPVCGHRLDQLIDAFQVVKKTEGPLLVHVPTKKGKGYSIAEKNPAKFHGIGAFDAKTGETQKKSEGPPAYTEVFGKTLCNLAKENKKIVAITAAMPAGTGLTRFAEDFPDRFYDVGIAEQHAVTFACGLATQGLRPLVAIYSTFLQRAFDQVVHDAALMNLPIVFALDRAGLVGDDGPTHHGAFDMSYLRLVPNLVVMAPSHEAELQVMLKTAFELHQPVVIRYPRGVGTGVQLFSKPRAIPIGKAELVVNGNSKKHLSLIAIGSCVEAAVEAARQLKTQKIHCRVVNARFAKPLDKEMILSEAQKTGRLITVEENSLRGGFGSAVLECLAENGLQVPVTCLGIPDSFVEHGSQNLLRANCGIDPQGIMQAARKLVGAAETKVVPLPKTDIVRRTPRNKVPIH